jgi:hypothetical protein
LTADANYKIKVGWPRTQAKLIIHKAAVKNAFETLRVKIAQQIYIIMKHIFPVDSQILSWTNKAHFMEELPLGSSGSKKLTLQRSLLLE